MRVAANRNMYQARLLVFVSCLLASISAGDGDIETGPSNIVVVVGQSSFALLECRVTTGAAPVQWYEFGTKPEGRLISEGTDVNASHPNAARYSIITGEPGQFDLRITPVKLTDGTKYMCVDEDAAETGDTRRSAQLITIDGEPNCTSTITSSTVVEGEEHSMMCTVNFQTSEDSAPVMTWYGPENSQSEFVWGYILTSTIRFTVTRSMDGQVFTCITNFTDDGFASTDPNMASNVPEWKHVWLSAPLSVNSYMPTQLPAVVSCSNVTGLWVSIERDQSLWLNVAQNGVMNGTLQIRRTNPLELYGQFQIDTWNKGGLTIFNANSIDVYILQCMKCNGGEDTMTVSQLQRSEMSTCQQPGVSSFLPDVKFTRVTVSA